MLLDFNILPIEFTQLKLNNYWIFLRIYVKFTRVCRKLN